jgi:hypothetical protein
MAGVLYCTVVALVQDCTMEGSGSRGGGGAVDAADWVKHAAYELGHIHTHACCGLGGAMRDKKPAVWANL